MEIGLLAVQDIAFSSLWGREIGVSLSSSLDTYLDTNRCCRRVAKSIYFGINSQIGTEMLDRGRSWKRGGVVHGRISVKLPTQICLSTVVCCMS